MNTLSRRQFLTRTAWAGLSVPALAGPFYKLLAQDRPSAKSGKVLRLKARRRVEQPEGSGQFRVIEEDWQWRPDQSAIVICDMWNAHWCQGATRRVIELAPRINQFVSAARERGVLIIHAPSSCMEPYQDHPARLRAQRAPKASNLPEDIKNWCHKIPSEEKGKYPIDQSDGGCDCEPKCQGGSPWKSQIDTILIREADAISDSGIEIWNLLEERGILNVMLVGVHTNMCVLGRPFGLRQMASHGKNTLLVRDLTDTMYNSKAWPHVSHFTGTDLIVEHIEKWVCPTTTSDSLLGGKPFRFREDKRTANGAS